ncbi:hypothetical protein P7K49_032620 [Saguinus oedipus]|uniref:Uncharacterized protein n=1 Tax=Saguinus oedipus TaxID=9490 RepID=A0ABQ9TYS7_SAGOE|nr:hypothetical protein P7K49_032620 [Saguinus oedipus]
MDLQPRRASMRPELCDLCEDELTALAGALKWEDTFGGAENKSAPADFPVCLERQEPQVGLSQV